MVMVECLRRVFAVGFFAGVVYILLFSVAAGGLTTDGLALLALKSAVNSDPSSALARWHDSDPDPCAWPGVTCRRGRVTALSLPGADLAGYLPSELSLLAALDTLALPRNRLSGPIPAALCDLRALATLDLSGNRLSGPIPPALASLTSLSRLDLSSNLLNGSLPPAIAALPRLSGVLNLSYNLLSGPIPSDYGALPVAVSLDLRRNNLSGEIPQVGSLINQGPTAFSGNPGLCGFPLKNPCPGEKQEPKILQPNSSFNPSSPSIQPVAVEEGPRRRSPVATVPLLAGIVVAAVISVIVLQWQFRRRRAAGEGKGSRKGMTAAPTEERRAGQSGEIYVAVDESFGLELEELLRASAYVVGKSRSGIVYKVVVGRGPAVAVRRLSEGEEGGGDGEEWRRRRAFEAEAAAIGRAKHPNVLRLRAYYYAPDEKLLIYDYIPNGTVHSALDGGPTVNPTAAMALPWVARLGIVQGAARGLAYLHECSPRKYIHGNITSSKILLDDELRPFVSGFGLTRLAAGTHHKLPHSAPAKKLGAATGSRAAVGPSSAYLAPELRSPPGAPATQRGDVYAFGVVALEVLTGRLPMTTVAAASAEEGGGGEEVELATWVRRAFKEERPLAEVVDPALLGEVHAKRQVLAVFHVALGCTEPDPELRPRMRAVSESLDRVVQPR